MRHVFFYGLPLFGARTLGGGVYRSTQPTSQPASSWKVTQANEPPNKAGLHNGAGSPRRLHGRYMYDLLGTFLVAITCAACSQASMTPVTKQAHYQPNSPVPVCRTKASMIKWMAADVWKVGDEGKKPDQAILNGLIKSGNCHYLPEEAIKTIGDATDNGYGPAPVTIRTDRGILQEWSFPVGGE